MRSHRLSLRRQLTTLVASLAVPLVALSIWWGVYDFRSARSVAETNALGVADLTALGVGQFLTVAEELMMGNAARLSRHPSGHGVWVYDSPECREVVATLTGLLPFLSNAVTVAADGTVVCSEQPATASVSASSWPWWDAVLEDPQFTVSDPTLGDFTGTWILPLVAPIVDDEGRFMGALVGTVELTDLSRLFGGDRLPPDHLVTVATADNVVIARSIDADDFVGTLVPLNSASTREIGPGRWVSAGPDVSGESRTWGRVTLDLGWTVYVGVPDSAVYGPALREALLHTGVMLLVIAIGVFMAFRRYARISGALEELKDEARFSGGRDAAPLPEGTPVEVQEILDRFNAELDRRSAAEEAERAARERFQSVFENAVFGLCVTAPDGRFLQVNPAFVEMLGYPSVEALPETGANTLDGSQVTHARMLEALESVGPAGTFEMEWERCDGEKITVRVGGRRMARGGGDDAFQWIVADITDAKRIDMQLLHAQKMQAIGQLASGVAHDFNNLLTIISGHVELLEADIDPDDSLRPDLDQISRATQRATSLTRRLLGFSRRPQGPPEVVDVNALISEMTGMVSPLLGESVSLRADLEPGPLPVHLDPGEVEQVVLNLLLNARDAMPGGGEVVVRTRAVSATGPPKGAPRSHREVEISVQDAGVGIPKDVGDRVFEPFFTTKPRGAGTGLGLSTVFSVVTQAGGSVDYRSDPGRGTTMTVRLPGATGEAPVEVDAPHAGSTPGGELILVAEDDDLLRSLVQRTLESFGFRTLAASDGQEALEQFEAGAEEISLVLTDVGMPRLGGIELMAKVRSIRPSTPVLLMSGYLDVAVPDQVEQGAAPGFIKKPFAPALLRQRVQEMLAAAPAV